MPFTRRTGDVAVTSPRMTDEHRIGCIGIEAAPRFVGDRHIAQRGARIECDRAVAEMQKRSSTSRQPNVPSAGRWVVGSLHVIFRSFVLHHEGLRSLVRCPLRDHIVTEVTWHRGFPVAGPIGRS